MPDRQAHRGALEAVDRILNRGADDVLAEVVRVVRERAGFDFVAVVPGPSAGDSAGGSRSVPVTYEGRRVAELQVEPDGGDDEERAFLERVAVLISAHCSRPRI